MNARRTKRVRPSALRRWAALSATAAVTAALAVGVAAPSEAASKQSTSLSLSSISHVATSTNRGPAIISGDRADLRGTASSNLVGRTLHVQAKDGTTWSPYTGSGTVSHGRTFSLRIRIDPSYTGTRTFRVVFTGTSTLSGATDSRSVTVWRWTPLVEVPVASTSGSSDVRAAAHPHTNLVVAKRHYASLLAGDVPAGGTGAATFDLHKHCRALSSKIGLTDSSPSAASIAFSVYFGDVAEVAPTVKHGATKTITLTLTNVSKLILRNTEPDPSNAFTKATIAAWPNARVLCSVRF